MTTASENLKGMFYMTLAMAFFTLADLSLKWACELLPTGQVMLILGLGCCLLFGTMVKTKNEKVFTRSALMPAVLLRTVGEALTVIFIFLALINSAFTTVSAILQTLPLLLTLISFLFLGEKVGMHRLLAVAIGFAGVLLIIRPGVDNFDVYSLYAVMAVIGMSMRDIGSRLAPKSISAPLLALYGAMTFSIIGLVMMLSGGAQMPSIQATAYLLGLIVFTSGGTYYTTAAMRLGEVSVIAPLRYTRLLFGLLIGVFILHEEVDRTMLLGSVIVVVAGLYVWFRERRHKLKLA
jgi:drug/metabolite transporter (DMT)-like permease